MKKALAITTAATFLFMLAGCASRNPEGVKSDYMTQWTTVGADTAKTTDAAKSVLKDEGLKEVMANSTNMDGTASGLQADGTKVNVNIKKVSDTTSEVSVNVGALGNPDQGSALASRIKAKAEGP